MTGLCQSAMSVPWGRATNWFILRRPITPTFQLTFTDLMEPTTPEKLRGHKYVSKTSDQHTKEGDLRTEIQKRCSQLVPIVVSSELIFGGYRIERLRANRGGDYINKEFKDNCLNTGGLLEYASTSTCPSASEELLWLWLGACSSIMDCQILSGEK